MRTVIAALVVTSLLLLAGCGGGSGGGGTLGGMAAIVPVLEDVSGMPGGGGFSFFPDDRPWVIGTPSGRFGVMNGNLPTVTDVEVTLLDGTHVTGWNGLAIESNVLWECPEGDDLPAGAYVVRVWCALGTAAVSFVRSPGRDGVVVTAANREWGF